MRPIDDPPIDDRPSTTRNPEQMSALAWLAIPVVALVLAIAWVAWAGRERPRADTHDTVLAHERFKAALERPRPPAPRSPDPSSGRSADREHDVLS